MFQKVGGYLFGDDDVGQDIQRMIYSTFQWLVNGILMERYQTVCRKWKGNYPESKEQIYILFISIYEMIS